MKVSISQAWDESRAVLARDGKLIATVALAMLVLPGVVVSVLLPQVSTTGPFRIVWLLIVMAAFLITFGGQLSIVRLAMGPHLTVAEAIRHGASRTLPFVGAFFLWVLPFLAIGSVLYKMTGANTAQPNTAAALALLALTLIGLFIVVRMLLLGPIATAEHLGPVSILRRSWHLTAGNWWRLFGFVMIFLIAALVLIWVVTAVLGIASRLMTGEISTAGVPGLLIMLILQVVTSAIYVVLFTMQARIYVQLAGRGEAQAGVPSSGT